MDLNRILPWLGHIIYLGGMAVLSLIGLLGPFGLSATWSIVIGLILWNAFYLAFGIEVVSQKEAIVIERFGQYHRTAHPGIRVLCFKGYIDKEKSRVNLQWQSLPLWADGTGKLNSSAEIDFEGGVSAPVKAETWFRIVDPKKWVYEVQNGLAYIEQVIDSALRPALQRLTLEAANQKKTDVAKDLLNGSDKDVLENPMRAIGVELHPQKGVLVIDIDIPVAIQEARAQQTQGEFAARKTRAQAAGYTGALKAIIDDARAHGKDLTWEEAEALYFKNRSLEAFQGAGANVTIIGSDVMGMAQSILGKFGTSQPAPTDDGNGGTNPLKPRRRT